MTPKDRFKVAFLTRLVEAGLSFDQIADRVSVLHAQVKAAAMGGLAPSAPPTSDVGTKPFKPTVVKPITSTKMAEGVWDAITGFPGKALDVGDKALGLGKNVALLGGSAAIGAGGLLGYGLGKLTDVDETDVEETKQRELIDQYRRWAEHARQTQSMHAHAQATSKPHFAGRF